MDSVRKDERFSHVGRDPRFKRIPKSERKVKIDKRFQSMFEDKRFKLKYTVDKRGRPANYTSSEDLKKFYELSSEESDESDNDVREEKSKVRRNKKDVKDTKKKRKDSVKNRETTEDDALVKHEKTRKTASPVASDNENDVAESSSDEDENLSDNGVAVSDKVRERLKDLSVDYARGEGVLQSDSSSEEESEKEEDAEVNVEHCWGELDKDAPKTEEATSRLALCHMDWDRVRAVDIMVLLTSFVPPGGSVVSVTIYPSAYGLQRLKEEEINGPQELVEAKNGRNRIPALNNEGEAEEGSSYNMEKLRQYQLNRLKYYYAVVAFDSKETAGKVYEECDGMEYESSAAKLDLRFIPDDTTFEEDPRELCDKLPDPDKYEPRLFTTTALQQANVQLTWDETDPERAKLTQLMFDPKKNKGLKEDDLAAYLACSSSEDENETKSKMTKTVGDEDDDKSSDDEATSLEKYRSLLLDIEEKEQKGKEREVEMEITWGVGLKEKTEALVKKKMDEKQIVTPFQQLLQKKKEKRQKKREEKKKLQGNNEATEEAKDSENDDDIPSDIDLDDPYFKEEFGSDFGPQKISNKKNKYQKRRPGEEELNEEDKMAKAELELLMMDDEDGKRQHFSLESMLEESDTKKKKKRRKQLKKKEVKDTKKEDTFQVDVVDPRFSALFTSHHYNIDPSDPNYKNTKGMETIITEKLKRRVKDMAPDEEPPEVKRFRSGPTDPELSSLVKSVKNKTLLYKKKS